MAKKEIKTDFWVYSLLKSSNIDATAQGSNIKEVDEALKSASKKGTGESGFPDFTAKVKDFLIVIEDKSDLISKHCKLDSNSCIDLDNIKSITDYAVNGAIHYAKHLVKNTSFKKIIAIGVSGDEKHHKISPYFINEIGRVEELKEIEDFIVLNEFNIDEYYTKEILKEYTEEERITEDIIKYASILHEDLRIYGSLIETQKHIVVSGILLALEEIKHKNFSIDNLNGDSNTTDGDKIYKAVEENLKRANVRPEVKKDKLLAQFSIIKNMPNINEINNNLGKTPLKHYTEFLNKYIHQHMRSSEDILGRFYSEFMSYSGGDGKNLGIVLTPRHICELFCELADLKPDDVIFDPCCGTGGFLVSAMNNMLSKVSETDKERRQAIKEKQLWGIEENPDMFSIATTNMILRGDGKSNLENKDFLMQNPSDLQKDICATVGMMNPPYSQGSKANPNLYEIAFTEHLLDSLSKNARVIVIIPQSAITGKTKEEKAIKESILKKHTLEGVITLNKNTFYGIGTNPCIAVFTAHKPHYKNKICKFINFENDGWEVQKHRGLVETMRAKDKKAHLINVWFDRMDAESKFCIKTTIELDDEWLHSFYYFNDEIPKHEDFEKTIADYLTFEFNMITHGKEYFFEEKDKINIINKDLKLSSLEWKEFKLNDLFDRIEKGKCKNTNEETKQSINGVSFLSATLNNNGVSGFVEPNYLLQKGNCIMFVNQGDGGAGYSVYKKEDFISTTSNSFGYAKWINRYTGLFVASILCRFKEKYSFGYGRTENRLKNDRILLPINSKGQPNWEFMENFMRKIEYKKLNIYLDYIKNKTATN